MRADLLATSAPLARDLAPARCHPHPGGRCDWYHGPWQYFRLLGAVSTAAIHEQAMQDALREAARAGARRVLVSGSTDYAMLETVHAAWRAEGACPEVTVTDICPTPLALCEWYGAQTGLAVRTVAGDILDFQADAPFDVVCTHAFLGYFDAAGRERLVRRWHAALRPGGRVITVQRIRAGFSGELVRFTPAQAEAFVADVAARAARTPLPGVTTAALVEAARRFTGQFISHPIRSRGEIERLFIDAGFRLHHLDFRSGSAAGSTGAGGPSVPENAEYAHVVAVRD